MQTSCTLKTMKNESQVKHFLFYLLTPYRISNSKLKDNRKRGCARNVTIVVQELLFAQKYKIEHKEINRLSTFRSTKRLHFLRANP